MNNKLFIFFLAIFLIVIVNSIPQKINEEVYSKLSNNDQVRVIVKLKEPSPQKGFFFKIQKTNEEIISEKQQIKNEVIKQVQKENVKSESENILSTYISVDKLKDLESNPNIEYIVNEISLSAFLQESVPLINASVSWPIQLSNINITGISETICVIDTGIDKSHNDLQNKLVAEYCFCTSPEAGNVNCCPDTTGEDNNATDNNGHGTHVAGIASANGVIKGVAINTSIVAIKILNSSGAANNIIDLKNAIDWCTTNSSIYNISVITMSLGTSTLYSNYCDNEGGLTLLRDAINNAVSKNISVIAATGNDGSSSSINAPSCIENATAVASSTKTDEVSSFSNRNNLIDLFAPGTDINSTVPFGSCELCHSSGYRVLQGTSMAAPHVAGAFALVRQFFRLQNNRIPTPSEIKILLNNTGKRIDDTVNSGYNYSRIDVFAAINSLDSSNPTVSLISPTNNTLNFSQNITFSCSANDVSLSNITFYLWNSTNLYNTTLVNASGTNAIAEFNLTNLPYETYEWNCLAYDTKNNFSFASANYTLTINEIRTTLNSPINNTFTNQNTTTFNCSGETSSAKDLTNITFFVWNSTNLIYNVTQNLTGTSNSTTFNYNLTNEIIYHWNCQSFNNVSNSAFFGENYTITYDITSPNVTLNPPFPSDATSNSALKVFYYNSSDDNSINNCSLIINNQISLTNSSVNFSTTQNFTKTFTPGTYNWQINCTDDAGNTANSSTESFVITAPQVVTSSGGGGGGSTPRIYVAQASDTSAGYTKELKRNEKIKFTTISGDQHTLTTNLVGINFVNLTIQSNSINLILYIGEERKFNLTSNEYYDLYIKLNSIRYQKVNLTIKTIYEQIQLLEEIPKEINETEEIEFFEEEIEIPKIDSIKSKIIIILIIVIWVIVLIESKLKKKHESIKTERKRK